MKLKNNKLVLSFETKDMHRYLITILNGKSSISVSVFADHIESLPLAKTEFPRVTSNTYEITPWIVSQLSRITGYAVEKNSLKEVDLKTDFIKKDLFSQLDELPKEVHAVELKRKAIRL